LEPQAVVFYAFGSPIVHLAHRHEDKALTSFLLRVGVPLAGAGIFALAGYAAYPVSGPIDVQYGVQIGALIGFVLGIATVITVDYATISFDEVKRGQKLENAFTLVPTVTPIKNGASVGVVGFF
jgi:hypothetical protein